MGKERFQKASVIIVIMCQWLTCGFFAALLKKTHRCESFQVFTTAFIMSLVFTEHGVIHWCKTLAQAYKLLCVYSKHYCTNQD